MSKIVLSGHIIVPLPDLPAVRSALPTHVQATRRETGCLVFDVQEVENVPGRFNVYEEFEDQAAFDAHQARVRSSEWSETTRNVERHYKFLPSDEGIIGSTIKRLHQHRHWVNQQLIAAGEKLTNAQLRQEFAIGQGSFWLTLTHLYGAEFVWLEALVGNEMPLTPGDVKGKLPGNQAGAQPIRDLHELQTRWRKLDERWRTYLDGLHVAMLNDVVYKADSVTGELRGTKRHDILVHVCTHAQYTSAQAVNILRQLGVESLPHTMLIAMARSMNDC